MAVKEALKAGVKVAPTVGVIIGTQMIVQSIVEKALLKDEQQPASFATILASVIIVGGVSAPPLAVFNGQTMGRTIMPVPAITFNETNRSHC